MIKSRVSVFIASADRHRSLMTRANMADQCIKACKMFESLQKSSIKKSQKKSHTKIASEASYVYILSGQKFISKVPKMVHFGEILES